MFKQRVFIIAEAGVNHNGDPLLARALVDAAANAGVDAVKFQTFKAEFLVTPNTSLAEYQLKNGNTGTTQYDMLTKLELSTDLHHELLTRATAKGITFLSTPFDEVSLKFLVNELRMSIIKIPSGELTNGPFLLECARLGKQVILSTGGGSLAEVRDAVAVLSFGFDNEKGFPTSRVIQKSLNRRKRNALVDRLTILHAVTSYPAPPSESNLLVIPMLKQEFGCAIGLSDHTVGFETSIAAVALGAHVIEKHFTLDQALPGPDHTASLPVAQLRDFVQSVRLTATVLGNGHKFVQNSELPNIPLVRRSLVALTKIEAGELFTVTNLGARRPAHGRTPFDYFRLLGTRATQSYSKNEMIK